MIYRSGLPSFVFIFIVPPLISLSIIYDLTFYILFVVVLIFLSFLRIQFQISEENLIYEVLILKFPIVSRKISVAQIDHIIFKRTGWARRSAVVCVKKGLNIRLIEFEPKQICGDLESFAIQHQIKMEKTKDYQLLEKYY